MASPMSDIASAATIALDRAASVTFLRLATLALAQGLDLATFVIMVERHGAAAEANPFVSSLLVTHGMTAVVLAKLALIVGIGALSIAGAERSRVGVWRLVGGVPLAFAIAAGLIGAISNTAVILH
jgi:hypothetical protein